MPPSTWALSSRSTLQPVPHSRIPAPPPSANRPLPDDAHARSSPAHCLTPLLVAGHFTTLLTRPGCSAPMVQRTPQKDCPSRFLSPCLLSPGSTIRAAFPHCNPPPSALFGPFSLLPPHYIHPHFPTLPLPFPFSHPSPYDEPT